jgi:hypothetical protein
MIPTVQDVRFLEQYYCGFRSSGMSHLVPGLPFPDISKEQWETLTQQQSVHPRRPESLTLDYSNNTLQFNCS